MSSRDNILGRIRSALRDAPPREPPPVAEVWPPGTADPAALALRFQNELEAVSGEVCRCGSMDEARRKLLEIMDLAQWPAIGAIDATLTRQLAAGLAPERIGWAAADWTPARIAELPAGLIAADCLLADTGTAMIACATTHERLMCYLPPVSIVVATLDRLFEHLPAAWNELAGRIAAPELRGEFVFITGPSRTADIEKILILGVHGPKQVIVLLVG